MAPSPTHDRREAQSVEIVLALVIGIATGLMVVLMSWLLRLAIGTNGSSTWATATVAAAWCVGVASVLLFLLRARRHGL